MNNFKQNKTAKNIIRLGMQGVLVIW